MAFFTVLNQVIVLFLLIGLGYALAKFGMIDKKTSSQLTNLLCYVISPDIIVFSFQMKFSQTKFINFLLVGAAAIGIHLFNIALTQAIYNKKTIPDSEKRSAMRFASVYANCGFMGFPLLQSLVGTNGLFYGSAYNGVFNLFSWTHGILIYTGKFDKKSLIKAVVNPNIIAVVIGFLFFRFSITLPGPVYSAVKYVSELNTPLSMIVIGTTITQIPLKKIFTGKLVWICTGVRNIVIPVSVLFLLHAAGLKGELLLSAMIPAMCPVAGSAVLYAKLVKKDERFPGKCMTLSTILSLVTVPLIVSLISALNF
jgi:predicted permease